MLSCTCVLLQNMLECILKQDVERGVVCSDWKASIVQEVLARVLQRRSRRSVMGSDTRFCRPFAEEHALNTHSEHPQRAQRSTLVHSVREEEDTRIVQKQTAACYASSEGCAGSRCQT